MVHPDFIINTQNATLLDRENIRENTYSKDKINAALLDRENNVSNNELNGTLLNRGPVITVSVPSLIAKRAITETPSQEAITDDITRKNIGERHVPFALSDAREQKTRPSAPGPLPPSLNFPLATRMQTK